MAYKYYPCEVVDIIDETPGVKRFFLRYPNEVELNFRAGQFVMFDLPIDSKITNRSYSIASPPSADNILELIIVINPSGLGTNHLFNNVSKGDVLMTSLPIGKFNLDENLNQTVCFICTGTGIAPFRSMIMDVINKQIPFEKIILIFGCRTQADILYRSEFENLMNTHDNFEFIPVLSRENWSGKQGYVHQVYQEIFTEKGNQLFYLCGWADMIKEAKHHLSNLVFDKKQIRFESYD